MSIQAGKWHRILLIAILMLSAYVHLWNPAGFPDIFFDEGIYMRRAVNVMETGNPQEASFYDHPYLGQLVLAGILKIAGFPEVLSQGLELSYMVPRIAMGLIAVLDTFLVYKIASKKFGKSTAVLAAAIFGLFPITWLLRRILLDTLLLPFLLSSILLALYSKDSRYQNLLLLGSASLLGMAMFTKVTAVTALPLVFYLMYSSLGGRARLGAIVVPAFAIPGIWPLWAMINGHMDLWIRDVFWQAGRGSGGFPVVLSYVFEMDPAFVTMGFAGFAYAVYKREIFVILWMAPFLMFVSTVGFLQYFHFIMIMPVMAIAAAYGIRGMIRMLGRAQRPALVATVSGFVIFGAGSGTMLITTDQTGNQFDAIRYVDAHAEDDTTILAGPVYAWILDSIYGHKHVLRDYSIILFEEAPTRKHMVIADPHYRLDLGRGDRLAATDDYEAEYVIDREPEGPDTGRFPYASLKFTAEGAYIEIKSNY